MAVAGSLAALMVRWLRAGPVLLSGLLILAAAAGHWALAAAAVTGAVALAMACTPVRGAGGIMDLG